MMTNGNMQQTTWMQATYAILDFLVFTFKKEIGKTIFNNTLNLAKYLFNMQSVIFFRNVNELFHLLLHEVFKIRCVYSIAQYWCEANSSHIRW